MGVDSNVRRAEGETSVADGFVRLVAAVGAKARPSRQLRLFAHYHAGARHFSAYTQEDALVQRANGGVVYTTGAASVGLSGYVRDRVTRDPAHPRDFAHVTLRSPVRIRWGDLSLSVSPAVGRFHFKPDPRFSAAELGGSAGLHWRGGRWRLGANGSWTRRAYDDASDGGAGAGARLDHRLRAGARLRYLGPWVGEASAGLIANDSNHPSGGYVQHELALSVTAPIGHGVVGSTKLSVVRILHDETLRLPDDLLLDDEGRTAWTFRLERALASRWSLVIHGGYWTSPFGTGPEYQRLQMMLGVSHR